MWILPKSLPLSGALDTGAYISDSNELSQICACSLLVRSKPTPAQTWLRKWKRDSWTRHLFGRILKPSRVSCFETALTSSLLDTHVSPSPMRDSAKEQTTHGISGQALKTESKQCVPSNVFSKTLRDISVSDSARFSPTWLSSDTEWKTTVKNQRGEYSQRLKSARPTCESASSFLRNWRTPTCGSPNSMRGGGQDAATRAAQGHTVNLQDQVSNWPTPRAEHDSGRHRGQTDTLHSRVKMWPTPAARDVKGTNSLLHCTVTGGGVKHMDQLPNFVAYVFQNSLPDRTTSMPGAPLSNSTRRLNPQFVAWLMGVPPAWTNCDWPETEFCQPRRSALTQSSIHE